MLADGMAISIKDMDINLVSLKESLNYLHVNELRDCCLKLNLSKKGKKSFLIQRILHFIQTGERIESPKYPSVSCAMKSKTITDLTPESLMLKGIYKNDLKTRLFFKKLIGNYFHFTAFGIDWLEDQWMDGKPPTYREFAEMWQKEYSSRKENPALPKEEWAYISFVQQWLKINPKAHKKDILKYWDIKRKEHKNKVDKFLNGIS